MGEDGSRKRIHGDDPLGTSVVDQWEGIHLGGWRGSAGRSLLGTWHWQAMELAGIAFDGQGWELVVLAHGQGFQPPWSSTPVLVLARRELGEDVLWLVFLVQLLKHIVANGTLHVF